MTMTNHQPTTMDELISSFHTVRYIGEAKVIRTPATLEWDRMSSSVRNPLSAAFNQIMTNNIPTMDMEPGTPMNISRQTDIYYMRRDSTGQFAQLYSNLVNVARRSR